MKDVCYRLQQCLPKKLDESLSFLVLANHCCESSFGMLKPVGTSWKHNTE